MLVLCVIIVPKRPFIQYMVNESNISSGWTATCRLPGDTDMVRKRHLEVTGKLVSNARKENE